METGSRFGNEEDDADEGDNSLWGDEFEGEDEEEDGYEGRGLEEEEEEEEDSQEHSFDAPFIFRLQSEGSLHGLPHRLWRKLGVVSTSSPVARPSFW